MGEGWSDEDEARHQEWKEQIAHSFNFSGLILTRTNGGHITLRIDGDDVHIWTWPQCTGGSRPTAWFGEELAQALAFVDGGFDVVRHK